MLSPTTIAIVAVGALIIFGPKKLPELARSLGKSLSEFKSGAAEAQENFKRELDSVQTVSKTEPPAETPAKNEHPSS